MSNELAQQLAEMKAQLEKLSQENESLKSQKRPGADFGKPVRTMKNGKIRVRHRTQIDINLLQALMLVVKAKDLIELCQAFRGGSIGRKSVVKTTGGTTERQNYDEVWITSPKGEKALIGTVSLKKNDDGTYDYDASSPQNKAEFDDRVGRWNALWKELAEKSAKTPVKTA